MRRPVFARWIRRELLSLANTETFSLRKLAAAAQNDNPRLAEPLLLYAHATNKTKRLLEFIYKKEIFSSYETVLALVKERNLETLALDKHSADKLPKEYRKFLTSYRAAYQKPENNNKSKQLRWERSKALQLEKGVSTAEVYNALALNAGNVNAYLKHGALDKLSLENATAVMKYLYSY
ncbi:MAG: hypothetical protein LBB42_03545 [Coriobacteriales bacterium]|jgi:hypothetical protein|nr:hypothetical protein [Coriobacteriales bacterium]